MILLPDLTYQGSPALQLWPIGGPAKKSRFGTSLVSKTI